MVNPDFVRAETESKLFESSGTNNTLSRDRPSFGSSNDPMPLHRMEELSASRMGKFWEDKDLKKSLSLDM